MKKLVLSILCTVVVSAVVGVNSFLNIPTKEQPMEQLKQETKIDKVDEIIDTEDVAVKDEENQKIKDEKPTETEKSEKKETKSKSTEKPSSSVSNAPKQESNSNSSNATTSQPTQITPQNIQPSSNTQSNNSGQKTTVSTSFYDSITGGKKDRNKDGSIMTQDQCFARGTQIQNAELDYVLDYNEQHPEAPIQPEINYFRCYPVIDEQGEGWYLHFFCRSGEGLDATLKSKY